MKKDHNIPDKDSNIKILVSYFQPWKFPKENIFFPIQAGKSVSGFDLGIQGDDTDENISEKNCTFSEFTAWYWAWKNIKKIYPNLEYIGISHYRRFFALNKSFIRYPLIYKKEIPKMENYENIIYKKLKKYDIILTRPALHDINLRTHYENSHNKSDYLCMKEILHEKYPEYDKSWDYFFENKIVSWFSMFISKYELFDKYFEWLFPLLFEAEKRIDFTKYDDYQKRFIAFLAERLLNVYVIHNNLNVCHESIYFIDNKINSKIIILTGLKHFIKLFIPYGILLLYGKIKNR